MICHTQKYKIVRLYKDSYRKRVIRRKLTLEDAQAHCSNPETSSSTATGSTAKSRTRRVGAWMDTYTTD